MRRIRELMEQRENRRIFKGGRFDVDRTTPEYQARAKLVGWLFKGPIYLIAAILLLSWLFR